MKELAGGWEELGMPRPLTTQSQAAQSQSAQSQSQTQAQTGADAAGGEQKGDAAAEQKAQADTASTHTDDEELWDDDGTPLTAIDQKKLAYMLFLPHSPQQQQQQQQQSESRPQTGAAEAEAKAAQPQQPATAAAEKDKDAAANRPTTAQSKVSASISMEPARPRTAHPLGVERSGVPDEFTVVNTVRAILGDRML